MSFSDKLLTALQIGCFSSIVVMKMNILLHFDFESARQTKIKPYICTLSNSKRHDIIT